MRLFIAAELPARVRDAVWVAVEPLRDRFPRIRWVPPENLHVTLKFLGATREDQREWVGQQIASVAADHEPFELCCDGVGGFPSGRRAKSIWVGLSDPTGSLSALASALEEDLSAEFDREERAYRPHLTVARSSKPVALLDALPMVALPESSFAVESLALYRSHLSPDGPTYDLLSSAPLGEILPRGT